MLEELFRLSQNFIKINNRDYIRYFLKSDPFKTRFSIVVGQRGVVGNKGVVSLSLTKYNHKA